MLELKKNSILILIVLLSKCSLVTTQSSYDYSHLDWKTRRVHKKVEKFLNNCKQEGKPVKAIPATSIDSVQVDKSEKDIKIYFNKYFARIPFRLKNVDAIYKQVDDQLGWWYRKYDLEIYALETPIEQLVPNFYRPERSAWDPTRRPYPDHLRIPIKRRQDYPARIPNGLYGHSIALWHSHGWYYNNEEEHWEWQRPRLFQTVEDLLPFSVTIPYLIPMLENSGANVFVPRERSLQTHEVIVDNDTSHFDSKYQETTSNQSYDWETAKAPGFSIGQPPYKSGDNPFQMGTFRKIKTDTVDNAKVEWIPEIPESGKYAVYISYHQSDSNITDAKYSVFHSGGKTDYLINQKIGGGTWIYLGEYYFEKGHNPETGKVTLSNQSNNSGFVSADAVRFGGGMGDVKRAQSTSRRPRFTEAARYYLQYAGMPDSLIYNPSNDSDDYYDDYTSRGEWVNYLKGAPYGPNQNRQTKGLGIPIDLSCAFHTDAGITRNGTVVGTLGIYSLKDEQDKKVYPDGVSRIAARDVTDIVQTQIVNDIQTVYDSIWTRRALRNSKYSEAYRPNVPAILIELFSHQNFTDMKYGMDPRFRFDLGRSIYKGILKFISTQYGYDYTVHPLPVTHFSTEFIDSGRVKLSWRPQEDPLEESAQPDKYMVYTRIGEAGFDNGVLVKDTVHIVKNLKPDLNYSFKVTALNEGGESFPSEILTVSHTENSRGTVLIVNGFDRICSPTPINKSKFKGFANFRDEGVPYKYDIGYTGRQFNYKPDSKWLTNTAPGWGASYGNYETEIIAGNTFDFPIIHGKAIGAAGYSYVSISDEAFKDNEIKFSDYDMIDIIYGEEKSTPLPGNSDSISYRIFTQKMKEKIKNYCEQGGDLFISGAYLASDIFSSPFDTTSQTSFARDTLQYKLATDHAAREGHVFVSDTNFANVSTEFQYNADFSRDIYKVEAPDAIVPANDDSASTIFRYRENHFSAGIGYKGNRYNLVIAAFPFETILGQDARNDFMKYVIEYLKE
ncbi:MAG: fibronectin type III domain-containing protein [Candidatus Marinimicrobia bacterium]|nr:fibronectin type III domain-containing protein [Candidatus Neomarinimicrobiota bacterium]